jgi:ribosomal protein S21
MARRTKVAENESIEIALLHFNTIQTYEYKRWTKKRYGYYEKPSLLRRKRKKMAQIREISRKTYEKYKIKFQIKTSKHDRNRLHLFIGLKELFARSGNTNSAGH